MFKDTRCLLIFLLNIFHCIICYRDVAIRTKMAYLPKNLGSCSEYFQYQRIGDFINGRLELYDMKMGDTIKMTFNKLDFLKRPRFNGIFLPDESSQTVLDRIQNEQIMTYRIDFPVTRDVPELIKILINGKELCSTKFNTSGEILFLQYTLKLINGSLPVFTYNINIPNFIEVETAIRELTPLIYGGTEIMRGEYPWLTAIHKKRRNGLSFICGGSLITSRIVLTAAHCLEGSSLNAAKIVVMLGRHDLSDLKEDGFVTQQIKTLSLHPEYKYGDGFSDADLALLELKKPVSFTPFIKPICLWSKPANESLIVNHSGVVAGWGDDGEGMPISRVPKKVKMSIVSEAECLRSSVAFNGLTSKRTLCARNRDGSGPCEGDSGGGLMINQNGRWMLRGVVSAGLLSKQRCNLREYTVYCDVAKHISWLKDYINQKQPSATDSIGAICGKSGTEIQEQLTTVSVEDICGRSDKEFPWLAAIYRKTYTGLLFYYNGVLISSRSVLAPGHWLLTNEGSKFPPDFFKVFLGRYDLNNIHENEVQSRDVKTLVFHPDVYLGQSVIRENNLVLLQMDVPVIFTDYMKPICLWSQSNNGNLTISEQSAIITSWDVFGVYDESFTIPTIVNVNLTSIQKCELWGYNESISSHILCVPRLENKNGGVLMIKQNERWFLRGINSLKYDYNVYMSKQYFVYSDISKYLTWIQKNMLT